MDFDSKALNEVKELCDELVQTNSKRNDIFTAMDNLYWMEWGDEGSVSQKIPNVKITRSPKARNDVMGAIRLMIATDPLIAVPHDINNAQAKEKANKIEKFCKAVLFAGGRVAGDPLHYDVVRSALLYDTVNIAINSTKDMLAMASDSAPAIKRRIEEVQKRTPFLLEVLPPKGCYAVRDNLGLVTFHRRVETTVNAVRETFGKAGETALNSNKSKKAHGKFDVITLCDYYDLKDRVVWLDGYETPIIQEEHGLPFIPIVSQTVSGSKLFDLPEKQHEPFLYTLYRSGLVDRQNLILTVLYTMIFSVGANPMFVDYLIDPDNPHPVDYSVPGGTVHYRVGERRDAMNKEVIDPSLLQGWDIAGDLEMQSTIYRQALGEPLGGNAPFSSVALLAQAGRLPLVSPQKKAGWAIGEALEIVLKWLKSDNQSAKARFEKDDVELRPDDIPDQLDIDVALEVALPQDRLQSANAANMLAQGDNPLVSRKWVLENVLNVGQPEDEFRAIWNERASELFYRRFVNEQLAQIAQMEQMAMQPGQAGGMPGAPGGMPPMGPPPGQGMPPNMMPPMGGPMPQPGMPNMGTPPQPGMPQRNVMPPEEPIPPMPPPIGRGQVPG